MIVGIGVDLVDVERIEDIIYRWLDRFLKRVFTLNEIRYCNNKKDPAQRFATRFAAKQAFIKALLPKGVVGIDYRDVEIDQRDARPAVNMSGPVKNYAEELDVKNVHLMVSHDGSYAVANVVIEA